MNLFRKFAALVWLAWLACGTPVALAGGDHDHDTGPAAAGPASPRFYAVSELYELVGVINGKNLTIYLDRFSDGRPIKDAKIDLELGGVKITVEPKDGVYEAMLEREPAPGVVAVMATVVAGNESDLLAGVLDIHADDHDDSSHTIAWSQFGIWGGAALAGLLLIIVVIRLVRSRRLGGAA